MCIRDSFTIEDGRMVFHEYFKLDAPQTSAENCVAHNGSLIPIPGRDVMVQGWYQGGINVFDWTDPKNPIEIAYHDRGPLNADQMQMAGSWSVYWYNGVIVNSEIARGLDIFDLSPSYYLSQNEIDAAKSATLDYLNAQGQPHYTWPTTTALAGAYADQLERSGGLGPEAISAVRAALESGASGDLNAVAETLSAGAAGMEHTAKINMLAETLSDLASM